MPVIGWLAAIVVLTAFSAPGANSMSTTHAGAARASSVRAAEPSARALHADVPRLRRGDEEQAGHEMAS
jgi:hypothetical protein